MSLNRTQEELLLAQIQYYFDDIRTSCPPVTRERVLQALIAKTKPTDNDEADFKQYGVSDSVKVLRNILAHPCPQNRSKSDFNDILAAFIATRESATYSLPTGEIAREPRGIFGLTAAGPATKEAVVNTISQQARKEIEKAKQEQQYGQPEPSHQLEEPLPAAKKRKFWSRNPKNPKQAKQVKTETKADIQKREECEEQTHKWLRHLRKGEMREALDLQKILYRNPYFNINAKDNLGKQAIYYALYHDESVLAYMLAISRNFPVDTKEVPREAWMSKETVDALNEDTSPGPAYSKWNLFIRSKMQEKLRDFFIDFLNGKQVSLCRIHELFFNISDIYFQELPKFLNDVIQQFSKYRDGHEENAPFFEKISSFFQTIDDLSLLKGTELQKATLKTICAKGKADFQQACRIDMKPELEKAFDTNSLTPDFFNDLNKKYQKVGKKDADIQALCQSTFSEKLAVFISDHPNNNPKNKVKTPKEIRKKIESVVSFMSPEEFPKKTRFIAALNLLESIFNVIYPKNKEEPKDKSKYFAVETPKKSRFSSLFPPNTSYSGQPRSDLEQKHIKLLKEMFLEYLEKLQKLASAESHDLFDKSNLLKFHLSSFEHATGKATDSMIRGFEIVNRRQP